MRSIRDFVASKIRRSESADTLSTDEAGAPDPELGAYECVLRGPKGSVRFHALGLILGERDRVRYAEIDRVTFEPALGGAAETSVEILLLDGAKKRIRSSPEGGQVLHATLRWIGNTQLRRAIAD